jgi:hypothetical protein
MDKYVNTALQTATPYATTALKTAMATNPAASTAYKTAMPLVTKFANTAIPLANKYAEKASQYVSTLKKETAKELEAPKDPVPTDTPNDIPKDPETSPETPKESETTETTPEAPKDPETPKDEKPDPPEISFLQQITNRLKQGHLPSLDFLPPFPAAEVLKIASSFNNLVQDTLENGKEYTKVYVQNETAKMQHKLDLNNALAEEAKNVDLKQHVDKYIDHLVLAK